VTFFQWQLIKSLVKLIKGKHQEATANEGLANRGGESQKPQAIPDRSV
jgi:hypothetical protein